MRARRRSAATIADIGRELGISAMTVSRALNGSPAVNEETRKRVLSHAEHLNYRPNRWARSLVTQKSCIVGMVVPDISHSYFSEITRALQDVVEKHGYDLMLCHTHGDADRELAAINMLLGSRVDGLVIASQRAEDDPGIFTELQQSGTPFVLIDRFFPDLNCPRVTTDDKEVGRIAVRHLIGLGHTAIGHIRGPAISVGRLRYEGFLEALASAGLSSRAEWIIEAGFSLDAGYGAMQQMLHAGNWPSAIFAANDPSAIGAIRACREAGVRVPEDISIVGAGAVEASHYPNPFLTSVDWSRQTMGASAAGMLISAMEDSPATYDKIAEPALLIRQSTAPPVHEGLKQCASSSR
ncbi:MAG: LacI family DNA-binding transcriptional regulator [Bryobacteraceae bacterium]|nr:LacI family DNA-binding transcriptional regulator [Bryobacteraceae bacterium]